MILILLLVISIFTLTFFRFSVVKIAEPVSEYAHKICLEKLPPSSNYLPELKALVCAENFTGLHQSELYVAAGLIHLFVVSGSHLILLEKVFNFLILKRRQLRFVIYFFLITYSLMCSLSAPVCRCLIAFSVSEFLYARNIHWPTHFKLLIVGFLTLALSPDWIDSLSLQLSWLAAFAASVKFNSSEIRSLFLRQVLFFLILSPTVMFFQKASLTHLLTNLLLAPATEYILFPLALLSWLFTPLTFLFDHALFVLRELLQKLEFTVQFHSFDLPAEIRYLNWILILGAHLYSHLRYVNQKRNERSAG
jgi:ComEC/Rec2-related protein